MWIWIHNTSPLKHEMVDHEYDVALTGGNFWMCCFVAIRQCWFEGWVLGLWHPECGQPSMTNACAWVCFSWGSCLGRFPNVWMSRVPSVFEWLGVWAGAVCSMKTWLLFPKWCMISGSCPPWSFLTNPDWCRQCGCWFVVWSHPRLLPLGFSATWLTPFLSCGGPDQRWVPLKFAGNFESYSVLLEQYLAGLGGIHGELRAVWLPCGARTGSPFRPFRRGNSRGISGTLASLRNEIWRPFDTMSVGKFAGNFESCGFFLERDLAAFWHYVGGEIRGEFRVLWLLFGARFGGLLTLCRWGSSRGISSLVASFWSEIWRPFDTMSVGKFAGNFEKLSVLSERDLAYVRFWLLLWREDALLTSRLFPVEFWRPTFPGDFAYFGEYEALWISSTDGSEIGYWTLVTVCEAEDGRYS